jgi:hypothetical protein
LLFYEMLADEIGVTFSAAQPLTPSLDSRGSMVLDEQTVSHCEHPALGKSFSPA